MSISTSASTAVQGGYYNEIRIDFKKAASVGIEYKIPILKDLMVAGREEENPSVQELAKELIAKKKRVSTMRIEWRGKTEEEIRASVRLWRLHYEQQILLLQERCLRKVIVSDEFCARTNIHGAEQFSIPLKDKLLRHWAKRVEEEQSTPLETTNSATLTPRPAAARSPPRAQSPSVYSPEPRRPVPPVPRIPLPVLPEVHDSPSRSSKRSPSATVRDFEKTLNRLLETTNGNS